MATPTASSSSSFPPPECVVVIDAEGSTQQQPSLSSTISRDKCDRDLLCVGVESGRSQSSPSPSPSDPASDCSVLFGAETQSLQSLSLSERSSSHSAASDCIVADASSCSSTSSSNSSASSSSRTYSLSSGSFSDNGTRLVPGYRAQASSSRGGTMAPATSKIGQSRTIPNGNLTKNMDGGTRGRQRDYSAYRSSAAASSNYPIRVGRPEAMRGMVRSSNASRESAPFVPQFLGPAPNRVVDSNTCENYWNEDHRCQQDQLVLAAMPPPYENNQMMTSGKTSPEWNGATKRGKFKEIFCTMMDKVMPASMRGSRRQTASATSENGRRVPRSASCHSENRATCRSKAKSQTASQLPASVSRATARVASCHSMSFAQSVPTEYSGPPPPYSLIDGVEKK